MESLVFHGYNSRPKATPVIFYTRESILRCVSSGSSFRLMCRLLPVSRISAWKIVNHFFYFYFCVQQKKVGRRQEAPNIGAPLLGSSRVPIYSLFLYILERREKLRGMCIREKRGGIRRETLMFGIGKKGRRKKKNWNVKELVHCSSIWYRLLQRLLINIWLLFYSPPFSLSLSLPPFDDLL